MKRTFQILLFSILLSNFSFAQKSQDLYTKLVSAITDRTGMDLNNKLIAFNVWSPNVAESRKLNQEFDKCAGIYQYAKLKGGEKGLVAVAFALSKDKVAVDVTIQKDGISKTINLGKDDANQSLVKLIEDMAVTYNVVFDKKGNLVYENLKEGTVFDSFNKLITR